MADYPIWDEVDSRGVDPRPTPPERVPRKRPTPEERWAASFEKGGPGECWLWTKERKIGWGGYGMFYANRRYWRAHRYAWMLANGPIPDGMLVLHTCDNPPCVNPAHLRLGTNAENMAEMAAKGRSHVRYDPGQHCACGSFRKPGAPCRACGDGTDPKPNWREERIASARRAVQS